MVLVVSCICRIFWDLVPAQYSVSRGTAAELPAEFFAGGVSIVCGVVVLAAGQSGGIVRCSRLLHPADPERICGQVLDFGRRHVLVRDGFGHDSLYAADFPFKDFLNIDPNYSSPPVIFYY